MQPATTCLNTLGLNLSAMGLVLGLEVASRTKYWFLRENTFVHRSLDAAVEWLEHIGPENRPILRSIIVEIYTGIQDTAGWFRLLRDCSGLKRVVFRMGPGVSNDPRAVWFRTQFKLTKDVEVTRCFV